MGLMLWAAAAFSVCAQDSPSSDLPRFVSPTETASAPKAAPSDSPRIIEARAKLNEILNRAEFRADTGPSALEMWRARINRWILEHLIALLRWLHISQRTGNYLAWGLILVAAVILFYVGYRWLSKGEGQAEFVAPAEPAPSDARQWLADAQKAAERGDYREAIHCGYWACVARLEDLRLLARDRARTPRESLRLLEEHPREKGCLETVTRSFELIWYGYRPASREDWATTKEQLENMGCLQSSIVPTGSS
jgi:hypothetical protein